MLTPLVGIKILEDINKNEQHENSFINDIFFVTKPYDGKRLLSSVSVGVTYWIVNNNLDPREP